MSVGSDACPLDSHVGFFLPATGTLTPNGGTYTNVAETGLFDVPCRKLIVTGNGNVIFTLWRDDTATAGLKITLAVTAGQVISDYLIRKIWSTGTSATYIALG